MSYSFHFKCPTDKVFHGDHVARMYVHMCLCVMQEVGVSTQTGLWVVVLDGTPTGHFDM